LAFWRPADGNETSAAYYSAITSKSTPSVLSLSRQNLPNLEGSTIEKALKGGYVLHEEEQEDLTIVSTGSEVCIAVEAAGKLKAQGLRIRVVSLPCWLTFDQQPEEYRLSVLRSGAPILSLEALSTVGWQKYSHEVRVLSLTAYQCQLKALIIAIWFEWVGFLWSLSESV
jgi:transketolase